MSTNNNYKKHIYGGGTNETISNEVKCDNADISSSHSSKLEFTKLTCTKNCTINVDHAATLIIDNLTCDSLTINVSYSSTLIIKKITCNVKMKINVSYSSTTKLEGGSIGLATGIIKYSSLGICNAKITTDDVVAETASTWRT